MLLAIAETIACGNDLADEQRLLERCTLDGEGRGSGLLCGNGERLLLFEDNLLGSGINEL